MSTTATKPRARKTAPKAPETWADVRARARACAKRFRVRYFAYEAANGSYHVSMILGDGAKRFRFYLPIAARFFCFGMGWDVELAADIVEDGREPNGTVDVESRYRMIADGSVRMAPEAYGPVDLNVPLLAIGFPGRLGGALIDGWHRIAEAHAQGVKTLRVHGLTGDDERACRLYPKDELWKAVERAIAIELEEAG